MFSIFEQTQKHYTNQSLFTPHFFEQITSTSDFLKTLNGLSRPHDICLTKFQTHGRGRGGFDSTDINQDKKNWIDEKKQGQLFISYSLELTKMPAPELTLIIGYALCKSLKHTWPDTPFALKAPNDLYITNKKIAGLLIETLTDQNRTRLIVGLGLNIFFSPQNIISHADCLQSFINTPISPKNWDLFLSEWDKQLLWACRPFLLNQLPIEDQNQLLNAFNQFDGLIKPYGNLQELVNSV